MQASVLTVSSYATRTSPVLRGKWVLENLLNSAPPPPPNNVPRLDESAVGKTTTLREQMEVHRKNPTCASCHRRMDPLGFGLENFDAIGEWRTVDGKFAVDPTGQLPDGRKFNGPVELAAILECRARAFTRALTSKLLTYALGRGPRARRSRHRPPHLARGRRGRLQVLRPRHRHRAEPAVPDAGRDRGAMIITGKHLPRRTFLKGLGVSLALPMLDAMTPAMAAAAAKRAPTRLAFTYVPNGVTMDAWTPRLNRAPASRSRGF